jgi:hypothetical protein
VVGEPGGSQVRVITQNDPRGSPIGSPKYTADLVNHWSTIRPFGHARPLAQLSRGWVLADPANARPSGGRRARVEGESVAAAVARRLGPPVDPAASRITLVSVVSGVSPPGNRNQPRYGEANGRPLPMANVTSITSQGNTQPVTVADVPLAQEPGARGTHRLRGTDTGVVA